MYATMTNKTRQGQVQKDLKASFDYSYVELILKDRKQARLQQFTF